MSNKTIKVDGCVCSECSGECSTDRSILQDKTDQHDLCGSNDEIHGIKEESLELKVEIDEIEEVSVRSTDQLQSGTNYIKAELLDVKTDITFQKDSANKKLFKFPEEDFFAKKTKRLKKHQTEIQSDESIQKKSTDGSGKFGKKFKCFTCNYATNKSNNLKKHKMTSKHKENLFRPPEVDFATKKTNRLKKPRTQIQSDDSSIQKKSTDGSGKFAKKFKCFTCNYATNKSNNLKKHKMTSKHKEKMFKSSEVDFAIKNSNCLKKPRTEVQNDESIQKKGTGGLRKFGKKFRCFFCDYATNKSINLKQHYMTSEHKMNSLKRHQCKNSNTTQHQTNHSSLQFEDPKGDIAIKDGKSLQQHQTEIQSDVNFQEDGNAALGKFGKNEMITAQGEVCQVKVEGCVCSKCSGECSSQQFLQDTRDQAQSDNGESLKQHQAEIHSDVNLQENDRGVAGKFGKRFKCTTCEFATKYRESLKKHQQTHSNLKPFECTRCDFTTNTKNNLLMHWKRIHDADSMKKFKCSLCDYTACLRYYLLRHQLVHCSEKPFKCSKCDFATKRKKTLDRHNFLHYMKKPFKCPKCDYATKQKQNLRYHLKNILAMNAWIQCSACDYVAGDKHSFALHQQMHRRKPCSSSEKLLCIDCNFETYSEATLIQHFQSAEHLII